MKRALKSGVGGLLTGVLGESLGSTRGVFFGGIASWYFGWGNWVGTALLWVRVVEEICVKSFCAVDGMMGVAFGVVGCEMGVSYSTVMAGGLAMLGNVAVEYGGRT